MRKKHKKGIKIDLHIHSNDYERLESDLSHRQIIELYARKGFDAIALTDHCQVNYSRNLKRYAGKKGILLIPGVEAEIEGRHVLIINCNEKEIKRKISKKLPENFEDLRKIKTKNNLIIAAHPFLIGKGIRRKAFEKHKDVFDAVEFNGYIMYLWFFNWNKKAEDLSKEYKLPLIGNSDSHLIFHYGATHSIVNSKKDTKSIINAIKKGRLEIRGMRCKNHFLFIPMLFRETIKNIEKFINSIIKKTYHA